jgi:uncharacterized phage-associated protein
MKLQKILYYCQAWSLVWDDGRLFDDPIEAWANGPVVRDVWEQNRSAFTVKSVHGNGKVPLPDQSRATIKAVMDFYGKKSAQVLSDLTHAEDPWNEARMAARARDGERSDAVISRGSMRRYYSSLKSESA